MQPMMAPGITLGAKKQKLGKKKYTLAPIDHQKSLMKIH